MALLEVRKSRLGGLGCFTKEPVAHRQKIASYAGELVHGEREIQRRLREQEARGVIKIIQMGSKAAIDGEVGGDATAYINHSCDPNAFMQVIHGERVMFFARRDIRAGEEITMDYRDPYHPSPEACRCGAHNCRSLKRRRR